MRPSDHAVKRIKAMTTRGGLAVHGGTDTTGVTPWVLLQCPRRTTDPYGKFQLKNLSGVRRHRYDGSLPFFSFLQLPLARRFFY